MISCDPRPVSGDAPIRRRSSDAPCPPHRKFTSRFFLFPRPRPSPAAAPLTRAPVQVSAVGVHARAASLAPRDARAMLDPEALPFVQQPTPPPRRRPPAGSNDRRRGPRAATRPSDPRCAVLSHPIFESITRTAKGRLTKFGLSTMCSFAEKTANVPWSLASPSVSERVTICH